MTNEISPASNSSASAMNNEIVFIDPKRLKKWSDALSIAYQTADPFPHIVIDDVLSEDKYALLRDAFPGPEQDIWYKFRSGKENNKLQSQTLDDLPWPIRLFFNEVNGASFTTFLEKLTGIDGLVPDPHLYGGGLHQTLPGGHLGVHIDYNFHRDWKLDRRLNAIFYFNDDWNDDWGGALELWDRDVKNCIRSVAPKGNRLVIFSTGEHSWHGHPAALACPDGVTRKSMALYYYSNGRPEEERSAEHNTVFQARPGETFAVSGQELWKDLIPPLLLRTARKLLRR